MSVLALAGRRFFAIVCLLLLAESESAPAWAQPANEPRPEFLRILQPPTPAASLEAPLAAKLADRLGQVWFDTAQPACREAKFLDLASYRKLARTLLIAAGEHMQDLAAGSIDRTKAETEFAAHAGPGGTEELQRITQDPIVAQLLAHFNRRTAVEQTLNYLENIERALLLNRVAIKGHANPLASGDSVLLEEIEKESGATLNYAESNKGKTVDRFLELVVLAQRAMLDSSRQEELRQWGPGKLMPILEGPLKEHCIAKP